MARKLTIADIAQLVGVSRATVSRVLNNKPDVDEVTRRRILQVIDAYGFVPDPSAIQLANGRSSKKALAYPAFPADFLWGTATSAYQIEGATSEDGRGPCIWDTFAREPGAIDQGATGDIAADHYHHMREDVALMASMKLNAYRFSVSWSRILPQGQGKVNERGLDFYDQLVDELLAHQICPVVTLYHWDLPVALQEQGGWERRETAFAFADYAEIVAWRLGDRVSWWITHNEPWCAAYYGYGVGTHAPGIKSMQSAVDAAHHLLLSHGLAVARLRQSTRSPVQVGITLNLTPVSAADRQDETQQGVEATDIVYNRWFLDPLFTGAYPERVFAELQVEPPTIEPSDMACIATPIDFLGINYYSRILLRAQRGRNPSQAYEQVVPVPEASYTAMAWEIYPKGLEEMLLRVHREYGPPSILITENGAAFEEQWDGKSYVPDKKRLQYLRDHISVLEAVLQRGVPIKGYFAWSLLDNFEWIDGYSKRFGLVYVDYATQRRIIKESGRWYAAFIDTRQQKPQDVPQN